MIKILMGSAALSIAIAASPASAQLLGGGGSGRLGGSIGGAMGRIEGSGAGSINSSIDRAPVKADSISRTNTSARTDKSIDRRKGKVDASGSASNDSTLTSATRIGNRSLTSSGSASGSANGGANAQLIGTDQVRSTAASSAYRARSIASRARGAASNKVSGVQSAAPGTGGVAGSGTGAFNGSGSIGGNPLALAGSAGAQSAGAFSIAPGMAVTNANGRVIGRVQSVRSTARGAVQTVLVKVGRHTVALPASNFSGSGNVLVSAMGQGAMNDAAK